MQSVNRGERHCATPGGGVVSRMLRPVSSQQHPAFSKPHPPEKLDKVISILTFKIAGGTNHQNWPTLSRIEIDRRPQHSDCIWRHRIASLRSQ
ncbi:MAG: hypothetical protein DME98_02030 [Verrucomicrobia bacterium]|nr:MAG: hypothetical protein DME98_02030 [Verrucomicrobiota bacterium]